MSNVAYTPLNAPDTSAMPGRVLITSYEERQMRLQFGLYFDGTSNNLGEDGATSPHSSVARSQGSGRMNGAVCASSNVPDSAVEASNPRASTGDDSWLRRARALVLMIVLVLPLTACGSQQATSGSNDMFGSSVTAMDHDPSDTFVRNVYVNGTWVGEGGRGGKTVLGGISLPRRWHPGLTAMVKWERCDRFDPENPVPDEEACRWTEKVVPVHKYNRVGRTWLHILENDKVLIIPSMLGPGHPAYPGPDLPAKDFFRNSDKDRIE